MCMCLHTIILPDCPCKHHPSINLESPCSLPGITLASPLHHFCIARPFQWVQYLPEWWWCPESWAIASWFGILQIPRAHVLFCLPFALSHPCLCPLHSCSVARGLHSRGGIAQICRAGLQWQGCDDPCTFIRCLFPAWTHLWCFYFFFFLPLLGSGCSGRSGT